MVNKVESIKEKTERFERERSIHLINNRKKSAEMTQKVIDALKKHL